MDSSSIAMLPERDGMSNDQMPMAAIHGTISLTPFWFISYQNELKRRKYRCLILRVTMR